MNITKATQVEFIKRASVLTTERIKSIFKASHMGRIGNSDRNKDELIEDQWVQAFQLKLKEINEAACQ